MDSNLLLAKGMRLCDSTPEQIVAAIDRGPMESHGEWPDDRRVSRVDAQARVAGPTNRETLCYSLQRAWRASWAAAAVLVLSWDNPGT
jgi:hypothetical protein